jgi:plastocyanin
VDCTPVSGNAEIDQDNLQFKPQELCVAAGQKVLFRNSESAIHTVTIDGKNESGNMKKGDTLEWTPPSGGKTYKITCDYHPQMRASVSVVAQ